MTKGKPKIEPPKTECKYVTQKRGFEWKIFFSILIPGLLTIIGWAVVSIAASKRDTRNKLREIRLSYLIEDYRKLANATSRSPQDVQYYKDIEAVVSDIQLFGSKNQIGALNWMLDNPTDLGGGLKGLAFDTLLNSFRRTLRKEIQLEEIEGNIRWHRLGNSNLTPTQLDSMFSIFMKKVNTQKN